MLPSSIDDQTVAPGEPPWRTILFGAPVQRIVERQERLDGIHRSHNKENHGRGKDRLDYTLCGV